MFEYNWQRSAYYFLWEGDSRENKFDCIVNYNSYYRKRLFSYCVSIKNILIIYILICHVPPTQGSLT